MVQKKGKKGKGKKVIMILTYVVLYKPDLSFCHWM